MSRHYGNNNLIRLLLFPIYFILKILKRIRYALFPKPLTLSWRVKEKANRKFGKLLRQFKEKNGREPTSDEKVRIAINASHITIRRKGKSGHWGRQKVRKLLLEERNIPYRMR